MAIAASSLEVKVGYNDSEVTRGLPQTDNRVQGFAKSLSGVGGIATLAFGAVSVGALAAGAGLLGAVSSASSFQAIISEVGAVSGATGAELQGLSGLALQMGKETSFSANEAAIAMAELAKGGIAVADMATVLPGTLALAAAGGLDLGEAATIAADTMAIFASQGLAMGTVADTLAAAANVSSISVQDLAQSLKYVGPPAAALGIPFRDLNGALALLGANGLKGSEAGTGLRTMLLGLAAPTDKAKQAMSELGLSFFDSSGHMLPLSGIAEELKTKLGGLTEQQRIATLQTLFGKEGMSAALAIMQGGGPVMDDWIAKVSQQGVAQEVAQKKLDNMKGSLDQMKGSAETAAIMLGLQLIPLLRPLVDGVTAGINAMLPFIETYGPKLTSAIAAGAAQALAIATTFFAALVALISGVRTGDFGAAFGPILTALDTAFGPSTSGKVALFVSKLLTYLQMARDGLITAKQAFAGEWLDSEAVGGPVRRVGQIFTTLGDTVRTVQGWLDKLPAPVLAVAAGFAGLGPALSVVAPALGIAVKLFSGLGPIISILSSTLPLLGSVIAALGWPITAVVVAVGLLAAAWATNFMGIRDTTMPIIAAIGAFVTGTLLPALAQLGTYLTTTVVPLFMQGWALMQQGVAAALAAIMPYVQQFIDFLVGQLLPGIQNIVAVAIPAFQAMAGAVLGAFQAALPGIQMFIAGVVALGAAVLPIVQQIAGVILASLGPAVMALVGWAQTAIPQFSAAFVTVWGIVGPVVGALAAFIGERLGAIAGFITEHSGTITSVLQGAWDVISGLIGVNVAIITGLISAGMQLLSGDWRGAWETVKATASTAWEGIQKVISGAWDVIKGLVTLALGLVKVQIEGAWTAITSTATTAWEGVKTLIGNAWDGITTSVKTKADALVAYMRTLPGIMKAALGNLGDLLVDAGKALIQGLIDGIADMIGALKAQLSGITSLLPDWKGPAEVDRRILYPSGQMVMAGFGRGLADGAGEIRGLLGDVTGSLSGATLGTGSALALTGAGGSVGGGERVINVYVSGNTLLGSDREMAAELWRIIEPESGRTIRTEW